MSTRDANAAWGARMKDHKTAKVLAQRMFDEGHETPIVGAIMAGAWGGYPMLVVEDSRTSDMNTSPHELPEVDPSWVEFFHAYGLSGSWVIWAS